MDSDDEVGGERAPKLPPWLPEAATQVLRGAVEADAPRAWAAMERIANEGGALSMFTACTGWAESGAHVLGIRQALDAGHSGDFIALESDEPLDEGDSELWAARFFTAACNRDYATAEALFVTSLERDSGQGEHLNDVSDLLVLVARIFRDSKAQAQAGGGGGRSGWISGLMRRRQRGAHARPRRP